MNPSATVTTTIAAQKKNGINIIKMARLNTLGILKKIPEGKLLLRPVPDGNHALWILGHLANVDDEILVTIGGRVPLLDAAWKENFQTGSIVRDGAAGYPAPAEVRKVFSSMRKEFMRWFEGLSDEQLLAPLPGRYADVGDHLALCSFIAWHESYHTGQLSVARKAQADL